MRQQAGGVFINYRTRDSQFASNLLHKHLVGFFGADAVFLDSESIKPGADFVETLVDRVRGSEVVLAVIGPEWLTSSGPDGRRALDDPADWIRRELVEAFAAGVLVVPVLVDGGVMPIEADLPADIARLGRSQYLVLRKRHSEIDLNALTANLVDLCPGLARRCEDHVEPVRNVVHQPSPRSSGGLAWPWRVGVVPQRAGSFQPRAATARLMEVVGAGRAAVLTSDGVAHAGVVSGMGGVGKTQIAADYAERCWAAGELDLLMWVTAASREAVVSAYAQVAAALHHLTGLPTSGDPGRDAQQVLEWWAGTPRRWLVVLDDVQNPADLTGLWPPLTATGRVVATTRRRDAALRSQGRQMIQVDVFTPEEAGAYLHHALDGDPHRLTGAGELTAALGYLPLALAQAAAYLLDRDLTCAEYHQRFTERGRALASLLPEPESLPDEHQNTVAATWSLSVEHANRLAPAGLAGPLLQIAALLDPNGIPLPVFTAPGVLNLLTAAVGREVDAEQVVDGLSCLHRLNLITLDRTATHNEVQVHALVQRATRDQLTYNTSDDTRLAVLAHTAADALLHAWPDVERDTALATALRANTTALALAAEDHLWVPDGHMVLFQAGRSLGHSGQVQAAVGYFRALSDTATQQLGPNHRHTLTSRHNLAHWRGKAGDPSGAAAAFEQLLPDVLRVLGPDYPHTLTARDNLAFWRGEAGDPAGAAAAFEQLLPDVLRVLGPDHPHTLTARNNLARLRGEAGDPAGAVVAFEQLLADQLRVLGPDDPDTLSTRHHLATWRGNAGDPTGAAAAFEQLLPDVLRVLGPDHPDTLTTRNNLAHWRGAVGDTAGAAAAYEHLLADHLRVLGPDHPDTLTTRNNLAHWQGALGDTAGAAAAYEQLLADRLRILGPDHPDTLTTRNNLAHWRGVAGDPAGAVTAFEQLLADQLRVLGPDTLGTRHNLAAWRGVGGDPAGAVTAFEQLLADRVRVLGPDHPRTLATRHTLAHWRKVADAGDSVPEE